MAGPDIPSNAVSSKPKRASSSISSAGASDARAGTTSALARSPGSPSSSSTASVTIPNAPHAPVNTAFQSGPTLSLRSPRPRFTTVPRSSPSTTLSPSTRERTSP